MTQLGQLAISDEGFVFNPVTGDSFLCNKTGLTVLKALKEDVPVTDLARVIADRYEIAEGDAERDVMDFLHTLRMLKLG